jgi:hypothetical protein
MAHSKICNAITDFMKEFPAVKKLWSVLSMHFLNSISTAKSASFDDKRKGNLHNAQPTPDHWPRGGWFFAIFGKKNRFLF